MQSETFNHTIRIEYILEIEGFWYGLEMFKFNVQIQTQIHFSSLKDSP